VALVHFRHNADAPDAAGHNARNATGILSACDGTPRSTNNRFHHTYVSDTTIFGCGAYRLNRFFFPSAWDAGPSVVTFWWLRASARQ